MENPQRNPKRSTAFSWLDDLFECVFYLAYRCGMMPFDVKFNEKQDRYEIITISTWQRGIFLAIGILTAIVATLATLGSFARATIRSPSIIFTTAPDIGDQFLCFMYWYVTWTREKQVSAFFTLMSLRTFDSWRSTGHRSLDSGFNQDLDVDQFLVHRKHPFHASNHGVDKKEVKTKRSRRSKLFPVTLCFIIIFLIELAEILKLYGKATAGMTSSTFLSSLKAHFTLVWGDLSRGFGFGDGNVTKSWEELSTLEIFLTSMLFQMNLSLKMVKGFAILLCIAGVALIYRSSGELVEYLNRETDQVHVMQTFQTFKDFLEAINEITGPLIFGIAIICAPTFYVANLAKVLITWSYESPIVWLTMIIYAFLLLFSAEVTNKTDEYREWILECGEGEYEHELFGIFVDLTQNPVGVRGMECFTVTHSFLAQMLSAVVTFTIILLQFTSEDA